MINWQYFPKSHRAPEIVLQIVQAFENNSSTINSEKYSLKSDEVLKHLTNDLENINFEVEKSKKKIDKIQIPILFGMNSKIEKSFEADAFHREHGFVLEVEAG